MADIGAKIGIDGERQFKQELAQITQAGKTLAAEMKAVSASFNNADASEKDLTKVSSKLNEQIANQQKLVDKLKEAVQRSTEKTGENSTETLKWKEKLAKAETALSEMESQTKETTGEVSDFSVAETDATNKTSVFGDVLKANLASDIIKKGLSMMVDAVKDVAKFFGEAVMSAAEYADEVNTLNKTTGLSTDAIQEFKYAAGLLDVEFETISGSLSKLTKNMDSARKGTGTAYEAFEKLGVSVTDANGELRNSEDVFSEVIDALAKIPNETERDAVAMNIFGKSARELNPLIEAGADALAAYRKEAHDVGAVMDSETLNSMGAFQDEIDRLKGTWDALKRTLGAKIGIKILPDLEKLVKVVQKLAETGDLSGFFDGIVELLTKERNWSNVGAKIGQVLGKILGNAPKILEAGIKLAGQIIKGFIQGIPEIGKIIADELYNSTLKASTRETIRELEGVRKKLDEIPTASDRVKDSLGSISANYTEAQHWIDIFDELSKKANPTAVETERLQQAVSRLNELFPELGLKIDEETGKWNLNTDEIKNNIDALKARYEAEAYYSAASDTIKQIAQLEADSRALRDNAKTLKANRDALQDFVNKKWDANEALQQTWQSYNRGEISAKQYYAALSKLSGEEITTWSQANKYYSEQTNMFHTAYDNLRNLNAEYGATVDTLNEYDEKINVLRGDVEFFYDKADEKQKEYNQKQNKNAILDYPKEIEKGAAKIAKKKNAVREATDTATGGIVEGIEAAKPIIKEQTTEMVDGAVQAAETAESGKGHWLGSKFTEEFARGEADKKIAATNAAKSVATAAVSTVSNNISGAKEAGSTFSRLFAQGATTNSVLTAVRNAAIRLAQQAIQNIIDTVNAAANGRNYAFDPTTRSYSMENFEPTEKSSTMSIGEMNIIVNARDGMNTSDLVDEIMYRMQGAVNSRKAVYGDGLHV